MKKVRPVIRNWFDTKKPKEPKIIRDKSKDKIINNVWRLSETKKENEQRKKRSKMKKINDKKIRDIRTPFE